MDVLKQALSEVPGFSSSSWEDIYRRRDFEYPSILAELLALVVDDLKGEEHRMWEEGYMTRAEYLEATSFVRKYRKHLVDDGSGAMGRLISDCKSKKNRMRF